MNLPNTWSVVESLVLLAFFSAVHFYVPVISFVALCISRNDSKNESLSNFLWLIPNGSFWLCNAQVSFGVGTLVAQQVKLTGSPSITDWFTRDNKIWRDTENKKSTTDVQQRFSRYNRITTSNLVVIRCKSRFGSLLRTLISWGKRITCTLYMGIARGYY